MFQNWRSYLTHLIDGVIVWRPFLSTPTVADDSRTIMVPASARLLYAATTDRSLTVATSARTLTVPD